MHGKCRPMTYFSSTERITSLVEIKVVNEQCIFASIGPHDGVKCSDWAAPGNEATSNIVLLS